MAPVEFIFIGVPLQVVDTCAVRTNEILGFLLMKLHRNTREEQADQILVMRQHVRSRHKDIRDNTACHATFWQFLNALKLGGDWDVPGTRPTETTGQKRKRGHDEAEYRPN